MVESMSSAGEPSPRDTGRAAPSSTVRLAVDLIWISIAVTVVDVALAVFGFIPSVDQEAPADAGVDGLASEALLVDTSAGALVASGVLLGVIATLAVLIRRGVRWARITYTVLAAVNVAFLLLTFVVLRDPPAGPRVALLTVGTAAIVASVVALYRPGSNRYFAGGPTTG